MLQHKWIDKNKCGKISWKRIKKMPCLKYHILWVCFHFPSAYNEHQCIFIFIHSNVLLMFIVHVAPEFFFSFFGNNFIRCALCSIASISFRFHFHFMSWLILTKKIYFDFLSRCQMKVMLIFPQIHGHVCIVSGCIGILNRKLTHTHTLT